MSEISLQALLEQHLENRLALFQKVDATQQKLEDRLDQGQDIAGILELLNAKNTLLDEISALNQKFQPLLAEWKAQHSVLPSSVTALLQQLEQLAKKQRERDEIMLSRFGKWANPAENRQENSQNTLNAFRALR
ncbi:MAG TPA: hypothetical protein VLM37_09750 [Fibrobacteraceae bacterium]|nr:hypothetical protein [Fibrobacteraceae bacterium]